MSSGDKSIISSSGSVAELSEDIVKGHSSVT